MHLLRRAITIGAIGAVAVGAWAMASPAAPHSPRGRALDPSKFVAHVTNPFFPLKPGTLWVYRGIKDGKTQIDRVFVTHSTKTIEGVHATVVRDIARQGGTVIERTFDWFAQDRQGNVWYLGEDTVEFLPNGTSSTEGSWETGAHGAVPGIVMEGDPKVADGYRQEFWEGHAEDQAWILARGGSIHVPLGTLHRVLKTLEWSPLSRRSSTRRSTSEASGSSASGLRRALWKQRCWSASTGRARR